MAFLFPSEAWTAAYKDAVNANPAYAVAGKPWTFGPVAFVVTADPSIGLDHEVGMVLDVSEGRCHGTRYVPEGRAGVEDAPFIVVASYAAWRDVIEGRVDPIQAMMQGTLDLVKGHLPTMIRFVESSRQLVASAKSVPTEFIA